MKQEKQALSANTSQYLNLENLAPSTFSQKSQSLKQQMERMNDKLFETDKLLQMQALIRQNSAAQQHESESGQDPRTGFAWTGQRNQGRDQIEMLEQHSKNEELKRGSPVKFVSKNNSPFRYSSSTLQRRKVSTNQENLPVLSTENTPAIYMGLGAAEHDHFQGFSAGNALIESQSSNNMTQTAQEMKIITRQGQHGIVSGNGHNFADELNQSCDTKQILRMSLNTMGRYVQQSPPRTGKDKLKSTTRGCSAEEKFETEEVSERSTRNNSANAKSGAQKTKQLLTSIINDVEHRREERQPAPGHLLRDEEEKLGTTPEADKFHIIPENSMEMSNSNKNSNTMEEPRQMKEPATEHRRHPGLPGQQYEIYNSKEDNPRNRPFGQDLRERASHEPRRQETQSRRNQPESLDQMDSKGRTQHIKHTILDACVEEAYLQSHKFHLTDHSDDKAVNMNGSNEKKVLTFKPSMDQLNAQILQAAAGSREADLQSAEDIMIATGQGGVMNFLIGPLNKSPLTGDISDKSEISNFGKSEPMQSDIETQRQTFSSNLAQLNLERNPDQNLVNQQNMSGDGRTDFLDMQRNFPARVQPNSHQVSAKAFEPKPNDNVLESYNDLVNQQHSRQFSNQQNLVFRSKANKIKDGAHTQKQQSPQNRYQVTTNQTSNLMRPSAEEQAARTSQQDSSQHLRQLDVNNAFNRNATSHAFLLNNERGLNSHFKIAKSPSFITSQEHYHGRGPLKKQTQHPSSVDSRRNHSLEEPRLGDSHTASQFAGMSPNQGHRSSQLLICKNQLSDKSKTNHQKIKENMIAQNNRNLSQQSIRMGPFAEPNVTSMQQKIASRSANNASNLSKRLNYTGSAMEESQQVAKASGDILVAGQHIDSKKYFHPNLSSIQDFEQEKESSQHQHISIQNQHPTHQGSRRGLIVNVRRDGAGRMIEEEFQGEEQLQQLDHSEAVSSQPQQPSEAGQFEHVDNKGYYQQFINFNELRDQIERLDHHAVPTGQSTNTWTQLVPAGSIPEQIHPNHLKMGEGGVVTVGPIDSITSKQNLNLNQLLVSHEDERHGTLNSYNTQNIQNLSTIFKHFQNPSLVYAPNGNQVTDPRNLRNFFIQSSLTFNGNNLNSNSNHKTGKQSRQESNDLKIELNESNTEEEKSGFEEDDQEYDEMAQQHGPLDGEDDLAMRLLQQKSMNPYIHDNSMMNQVDLRQFQTHQHQHQMPNDESTSGFFSGPDLANLRTALNGLDRSTLSKLHMSNANEQEGRQDFYGHRGSLHHDSITQLQHQVSRDSTPGQVQTTSDISYLDCQGLLSQALQPDCVFDLPSAVLELQKAIRQIHVLKTQIQEYQISEQETLLQVRVTSEQNDQLQQELIQVETEKLQIEQEMLELVEQRKQMKQENLLLKENISYQSQLNINLQQRLDEAHGYDQSDALIDQVQFLQQALGDEKERGAELEKHNTYLVNRDLEIQTSVQRLKSKYKQKLLQRQQEMEEVRLQYAELQQQFNIKIEEINQIQNMQQFSQGVSANQTTFHDRMGPRQIMGSFGNPGQTFEHEEAGYDVLVDSGIKKQQDYQRSQQFSDTQTKLNSQNETKLPGQMDVHRMSYQTSRGRADSSQRVFNHGQTIQNSSTRDNRSSENAVSMPFQGRTSKHNSVSGPAGMNQNQNQNFNSMNRPNFPNQHQISMNIQPITSEIENLRGFVAESVQALIKLQQEQVDHLRAAEHSRPPLSSRSAHHQSETVQELNQVIKSIKGYLGDESFQIKQKLQLQEKKIQILQGQNDQLHVENARKRQQTNQYQSDVVQLQMKQGEIESSALQRENEKVQQLNRKVRELEEKIVQLKLSKDKPRAKSETRNLTEQLKTVLGFALARVGYRPNQVPEKFAMYLSNDINFLNIQNDEILKALQMVDEKIDELQDTHRKAEKLKPLRTENKELLRILHYEQKNRRQLQNKLQEIKGNIRVICRIRPVQTQERRHGLQVSEFKMIGTSKLQVNGLLANQQKTFKFDKVFRAHCKQDQVHDEVQGMIESAMEGYNVCIMAYGQTGSGKTYTMVGDDKNPGLYFTSVDEIYGCIRANKDKVEYDLSVSVIEIYNEQIRDLLNKDQSQNQFKILEGADGNLYGEQIKRRVSSKNNILKALRDACYNRTVGVTELNEYSSRSHFIMTLFITGYDKITKQVFRGKLSLVDLAGSERILKTNADGIRVKEANNINQSLATLGKVILHLQNKSAHVPYRDSKLTHYLKDSLGGNAKSLMILQISPLLKDAAETLSSLQFGQRTQFIEKGRLKADVRFGSGHRRSNSQISFVSTKSKSKKKLKKSRSISNCSKVSNLNRSNYKSQHDLARSRCPLAAGPAQGARSLTNSMIKLPKASKKLKGSVREDSRSQKKLGRVPQHKRSHSRSALTRSALEEPSSRLLERKRHTTRPREEEAFIVREASHKRSEQEARQHHYRSVHQETNHATEIELTADRSQHDMILQSPSIKSTSQFVSTKAIARYPEDHGGILNINTDQKLFNEHEENSYKDELPRPWPTHNMVSHSSMMDSQSRTEQTPNNQMASGQKRVSLTVQSNASRAYQNPHRGLYSGQAGLTEPALLAHTQAQQANVKNLLKQPMNEFINITSSRSPSGVSGSHGPSQKRFDGPPACAVSRSNELTQNPTVAQTPSSMYRSNQKEHVPTRGIMKRKAPYPDQHIVREIEQTQPQERNMLAELEQVNDLIKDIDSKIMKRHHIQNEQ